MEHPEMASALWFFQYILLFTILTLPCALSWSGAQRFMPSLSTTTARVPFRTGHSLLMIGIIILAHLTNVALGMVLWSGVGDSALSRHTTWILYVGADVMAASLVLQTVRPYGQKIFMLRVLILINLVTLRTVDQHWWLLATTPSVNLLLGSCILITAATWSVHITIDVRSDSGLNAVVSAVVWIVSLQLQPLSVDPGDYIRSTMMVGTVVLWSSNALVKLFLMLTWSLYCLWSVQWAVLSSSLSPSVLNSTVTILRRESSDAASQNLVTILCTLATIICTAAFTWCKRDDISHMVKKIRSWFGGGNGESSNGNPSLGRLEEGSRSEVENDVAPPSGREHSGRPTPSPNILRRVLPPISRTFGPLYDHLNDGLERLRVRPLSDLGPRADPEGGFHALDPRDVRMRHAETWSPMGNGPM